MSTYEHEFLNIEVPASSNIFVQFISLFMTKFIYILSEIYLLIYTFGTDFCSQSTYALSRV
jgi:hypothetical protein